MKTLCNLLRMVIFEIDCMSKYFVSGNLNNVTPYEERVFSLSYAVNAIFGMMVLVYGEGFMVSVWALLYAFYLWLFALGLPVSFGYKLLAFFVCNFLIVAYLLGSRSLRQSPQKEITTRETRT